MENFNEYVFCPYCGGITIPGICVNCGMRTESKTDTKTAEQSKDIVVEEPVKTAEPNYSSYQPQGQSAEQNYSRYQPKGQSAEQNYSRYQPQGQSAEQSYSQYQPQGQSAEQNYSQYQPKGQPTAQNYVQTQQFQQNFGQMYGQTPSNNVQSQQPDMSYSYQPPKKKMHWWIWLLVIALILVLGVVIVFVAVIAAMLIFNTDTSSSIGQYPVPSSPTVTVPVTSDDSDSYDYAETIYARELGRLDFSDFDWESYAEESAVYSDTSDGSNDFFLDKDYISTFGSNHDNHKLSEFTGEYYEPFVDCIDTSYDYGMSRHFISYSNVKDNTIVNANIAYIQLEGDTIPNEDELNQQILEQTANDFWGYLNGQKDFYFSSSDVTFMIDSFIPYNDGEKMSILLDVNIYDGEYRAEHYIYGINIDLVNGEIMDNASILEIDEDFAAMFRERNDAQNGTDVTGVINASDEEIADLLSSADTNIIFFSPYGMEIGYNYSTTSYSWGWVSITLSDYEQYLK